MIILNAKLVSSNMRTINFIFLALCTKMYLKEELNSKISSVNLTNQSTTVKAIFNL